MSILKVRASGVFRVILSICGVLSAGSALAQVNITFESPNYSVGNLIGQDGWGQNPYVTDPFFGGPNGSVNVSTSAPLSGSRSLLYDQTSVTGTGGAPGASDVSKAAVITVPAGLLGPDLTVTYQLSAVGNAQSSVGIAGLFLSHDATGGLSPVFARLNGPNMEVGNGAVITTVPGFTYFDGDVLQMTYNVDFDTSSFELSVNNLTTQSFEFAQSFSFLGSFVAEGPSGEYLVDVSPVLRAGTARIDSLSLTPGTGSFVAELEWSADASGNWSQAGNWNPAGVPGTNPGRQTAIFGGAITSPQTVFTNSSRSVNRVEFDNVNSYVVAGPGSIDLQADTSGGSPVLPTIQVDSGSHEFQIEVNLLDDATVTVVGGAGLDFNNQIDLGGNTLTTSGAIRINHSTVGGGTVVSLGSLATSGTADIGGDLASIGTISVSVDGSGSDFFNVAGDATLSGILDVEWDPNALPIGTMTVLSTGGVLDASGLSLSAGDARSFALGTEGNNLTLTFLGIAVPEPATLGLTMLGLLSTVLLRSRRMSELRLPLLAVAIAFLMSSMTQSASAQLINFEAPTYSTGNLVGQQGWVQNSYITPVALNGTIEVASASPLVGSQSLLYTQTSAPAGFAAADVSKPFVAFGTADSTTAVDLTATVRIQAGANSFPANRIGVFLSDNAFNGFSPVAVILNGGNIETLHTTGFVTAAAYTPNNVIEFQIGVNFDNSDYEVSYRDITAGGPLTPLVGPLAGGRYGFFDNPNRFPADGDGITRTVDVGTFLRGGVGRIDEITIGGDDFIQATWFGGSGNWATNNSWIPQLVPNAPTGNGQIVIFGDRITTPQTVFTNTTQTVNGLQFDNANKYAIAGTGAIALKSNTIGGTVAPTIDVLEGAHELQVAVDLLNSTTITTGTGTVLDFNNSLDLSGQALTIVGDGTVNLNIGVVGGGSIANSAVLGTAGSTTIQTTLSSTGTLQIDLGPANTDFFNIMGNATVSGLLDVVLEPGYTPAGTYTVLTTSGTLNAAGLALDPSDAGQFSLGVSGNSLVLTVGGGLDGDFDNDGDVDGRDFLIWQRGGSPSPLSAGDLADWQSNYGAPPVTALAASSTAVPEPSAIGLLASSLVACSSRLRRRRETASH